MSKNTTARTTSRTESEIALSEEDVLELLPWYAGGKTSPQESAAIERRLAANPRLQAELQLVRQEKQVSVESVKALGEPTPELLDKMLGQLDGMRQLPPIARDGAEAQPGFLARLFGFSPSPAFRYALVAACVVFAVECAALLRLSGTEDAGYQTASAPEAATGPQLIVRFQPDAKFSAVTVLLSDLNATVVKGPMPDGALVIALQPGADPNAAMTALRGHADLVAGVDQGS
jgi:anti-sigma factor RsiW